MQYIAFHENSIFRIALLSFELDYESMKKSYIDEGLIAAGADASIVKEVIAYKLPSIVSANGKKRKALAVAEQREFLTELLETLQEIGVRHVIVSQPDYYKTLTGSNKAALEVGAIYAPEETYFKQFSEMRVTFAPNHKMVFYDPIKTKQGIDTAMKAVIADRKNAYVDPGKDIIKFAYYPQTIEEVYAALNFLNTMPNLTADIEGFSLEHHDAGIASIAFAWNENEGIAFPVDFAPGYINHEIREALLSFFQVRYEVGKKNVRKLIWHNAAYDLTVLVYQLFTETHNSDVQSMHEVFDWLTSVNQIECTKIISYLATNSCAGNKLSLKEQAVEFAGNYAVKDIKDVTKIPIRELLEYNLVDCLSTWYVYNKNYPLMVSENQEHIYRNIFLPSLVDVVDMQLTGLPVDVEQVVKSKAVLKDIRNKALDQIRSHPTVLAYTHHLKEKRVEELNTKWKKKRTTVAEIELEFNPDSDLQLAGLLYDKKFMGLPILGLTDSGAPSTKGKYIHALKDYNLPQDILDFLGALIDLKDSGILLSTFIPALEGARLAPDENYYMHGNFNLGGTVSGRLSSSDPNLQNIPSKSRLAKWIKICIKAAKGWLFVGLDFDSLEDKISALLTKDPNKLKVYTDGYDGHCLRAYSYFKNKMTDIDGTTVEGVNSISEKYGSLRQNSKAPTFLLTYGGTHHGLMNNCGFDALMAMQIETNYHELYKVSDVWVKTQIDGAMNNGYVEAAFGLRVRTPILHQVVLTERHTPYAAKAEARTAGNALGQSWGLLNNRAGSEFMRRVRQHGTLGSRQLRNDIKPCCQIHDAQYYLVRDDVEVLVWFNQNLIECVTWQDHPAISHPDVKISGQVAIYFPNWANEYKLPTRASVEDVHALADKIKAAHF